MIVMRIDWEVMFLGIVLVLPRCCFVPTLPSGLTSYPYCAISPWSAWSFPSSGPPPLLLLFQSLVALLVLLLITAILVGHLGSGDLFVGAGSTECCLTSSGWCWSCWWCGPPPLFFHWHWWSCWHLSGSPLSRTWFLQCFYWVLIPVCC